MVTPVRIRVLQSFPEPRATTNPYLSLLARSLAADVDILFFSWRTALSGDFDVFHVHWPESLLHARTRPRGWLRRLRYWRLTRRLQRRRIPVVRTAHNPAPHEELGWINRRLLARMDRLTTCWITLNPTTPTPDPAHTVTIPHGHYVDWYADFSPTERVPGRLLTFGLVRRYKGIPDLLRAFAHLPGVDMSLHIAGSCSDPELREEIETLAERDPRVTLRLEYLGETELAGEIGAAQVVVLPYREMHNSGAALLSLSLGRPVLIPQSASSELLAGEVGDQWVLQAADPSSGEALADALRRVAALPATAIPDLSARDWPAIAAAHVDIYRRAVELRTGGRISSDRSLGRSRSGPRWAGNSTSSQSPKE